MGKRKERSSKAEGDVAAAGASHTPHRQAVWSSLQLTPSQGSQTHARTLGGGEDRNRGMQRHDDDDAAFIPDEQDLAVHKTKVAQFKDWLHRHPSAPHTCAGSRLLLLCGPPGSGKSTMIRSISNSHGYHVTAWCAPSLMLWTERELMGKDGPGYVSKIDAFKRFLSRSKYPSLDLTKTNTIGASGDAKPTKKLVVIDDVPHPHSREAQQEIIEMLQDLAFTARHPTIYVVTEISKEGNPGKEFVREMIQFHVDLRDALEGVGVERIFLPAVNKTNMIKALKQAALQQGVDAGKEKLEAICGSSTGDLRNAVQTLKMVGSGFTSGVKNKGKGKRKRKQARPECDDALHKSFAKDAKLSPFHAIGKILYNKRENMKTMADDTEGPSHKRVLESASKEHCDFRGSLDKHDFRSLISGAKINPKFWREKSSYNPEEIVAASGLDGQEICGFLFEHYLHFMKDDAIEDACQAAEYLCDSELMSRCDPIVGSSTQTYSDQGFLSQKPLFQVASESVAVRGILFSNTDPQTQGGLYKFHGPRWKAAHKAQGENLSIIKEIIGRNAMRCTETSYAEDMLPAARVLANWLDLSAIMPQAWAYCHQGEYQRRAFVDQNNVDLSQGQPRIICRSGNYEDIESIED